MAMLVIQAMSCRYLVYSAFSIKKLQYKWQIKSSFIRPLRNYDDLIVYATEKQHRVKSIKISLQGVSLNMCEENRGLTQNF